MSSERLPDETAVEPEPTAEAAPAVDAPAAPDPTPEPERAAAAEAAPESAATAPAERAAAAEAAAETAVTEPAEPAAAAEASAVTASAEPAAEPDTAESAAEAPIAEPGTPVVTEPVAPEPTAEPLVPRERFARARRIGRRVRPIFQVGLFVGGIALGYTVFQMTRPIVAPEAVVVADVNASSQIPPAVRDLVGALRSDDQTAVRAVLDSEPYRLLAGELSSMNFQKIDGVDTLSTYTHDNLAATEIVIRGENAEGSLVAINLVVHQKDNVIVSFR
jgi:hypothetical protein